MVFLYPSLHRVLSIHAIYLVDGDPMRILVLDDNLLSVGPPKPAAVGHSGFQDEYIVQVARPSMFWAEYDNHDWDEIWLDHDLGTPMYNGRSVTRRFANMCFEGYAPLELFRVITMNPNAGDLMISDLTNRTNIKAERFPISILNDLGVTRGDLITDRSSVYIVNNPQEREN